MEDNISKIPTSPLSRSSSAGSNVSAISFASEDLDVSKEYDHAPWDIYGEVEGLGRIRLVNKGADLPMLTGYKTKKDATAEVGVQFRYIVLVDMNDYYLLDIINAGLISCWKSL